jgi:hypothetical protein
MLATTKFICAEQTEQGLELEVENLFNGKSKMTLNNITLPEFMAGFARWKEEGVSVKDAFPQLTAEEHEFLLSGMTVEQQKELYHPEQSKKMSDLFFGNGDLVPGIGG